jgi:hypothetical protein
VWENASAEAPGVGDGGSERGGRACAHPGKDDRHVDSEKIAQRCPEHGFAEAWRDAGLPA